MTGPRTKAGERFRVHVPHEQRIALRETLLRGAARTFAEATQGPNEENAARELADAAILFAVAILQRGAAGRGSIP